MPAITSFPTSTPGAGSCLGSPCRSLPASRACWAPASRLSPVTPSSPGICTSCGAVDRMSDPFEGLFDSGRVLERMGVELTAQARRSDLEPVRCRDPEIARVIDILLRHNKNNPALIGKAGVGKPALVRGDIRVIGATTGGEYDKWIRGDPALERRFQPVTVEELDEIETWEVLVARRPRLERHHAVAITDDALKAAIVLTDRFVPERARPDKAIDVLDEACAHAQATARVSPELERLIRERRKVDAMTRRGLTHAPATGEGEPAEDLMAEIFPVLERIGEEIEKMLGGKGRQAAAGGGRDAATGPAHTAPPRPFPRLADQRARLDALLRQELERQGIVVSGQDIARVVGAAVGKGIEWTG